MSATRAAALFAAAAALGAAGFSLAAIEGAAGQDASPDLPRGHAVYEHWCAPCHAPGPGHPGTQSLAFKYDGERPAVLEEREDLTPDTVKLFVRQGVLLMTPFRKTEITDAELDALAAYLVQAHTQD